MKVEQKKISIIVPVFNAEKTIERCADSIMNQNYKNMEIILVDDGSTDNSLKLCHALADEDGRFVVLSQPNGGVSAARNAGLEAATGDYVQFVDSDDYVESDHSQLLMESTQYTDCDMVISGFTTRRGNQINKVAARSNEGIYSSKQIAQIFLDLYQSALISSPCNKLYLRSIIQSRFRTDMTLGEDMVFNMEILKGCRKIILLKSTTYVYCNDSSKSITVSHVPLSADSLVHYSRAIYSFLSAHLTLEEADKLSLEVTRISEVSDLSRISNASGFSVAEKTKLLQKYHETIVSKGLVGSSAGSQKFALLNVSALQGVLWRLASKRFYRIFIACAILGRKVRVLGKYLRSTIYRAMAHKSHGVEELFG